LIPCPRCQGSMYRDEDEFGPRLVCRQCGRDYELPGGRYEPYNPQGDDKLPIKQRLRAPWSHYHR